MKTKRKPRLLIAMLAVLLLIPSFAAAAEGASSGSFVQSRVEPISVLTPPGSAAFELLDLNIMPSGSSRVVSFTISVENKGSAPLSLIEYWVRVRSKSGSTYNVYLHDRSKNVSQVPPHSKRNVTYFSIVDQNTELDDLDIVVLRWNFNVDGYEEHLGRFTIPAGYSSAAATQGVKRFHIGDILVQASVTGASLGRSESSHSVSVQLELTNAGSTSVPLPNYQFFILTGSGILYPLETSDQVGSVELFPYVTKSIRLRGTIPLAIDTTGWQIVLAEKDNPRGVYVPDAAFRMPAFTTETETVAPGESKNLDIQNSTVTTRVEHFSRSRNDANYVSSITFSFENIGQNPVTIPRYEFGIRTGDGLTYPVSAPSSLGSLVVNPKVKEEIRLNVTIPAAADAANWSLVLYAPSEGAGVPLSGAILGMYRLPDQPAAQATVGTPYIYTNGQGRYVLSLSSVQRYPWEDQDILVAQLKVSNPSASSKPLLPLQGKFVLDNIVEVPFQVIQRDNVIAIGGYKDAVYNLYAKIPYTYEYTNLSIELQEKTAEGVSTDIIAFSADSRVQDIPEIAVGKTHSITGVGRQSEVSVRLPRTYTGPNGDIYTVLIDVRNLEKRFANIASLVGHFRTKDGAMYPANITPVANKVSPSGFATLYAWTQLPKDFDKDGMTLILGEGVSNNQLIPSGGQPDAYINAVSFALPAEDRTVKSEFANLVVFPYTLSLSNFSTSLVSTQAYSFSFQYSLSKNTFVETGAHEHQIKLKFKDQRSDLVFSKTFGLEQGGADGVLQVGEDRISFLIDDPAILIKLQHLDRYTVEVYDVFMGEEYLLAKKDFDWFTSSN